MSRLRVVITTPTISWHLVCVIGSRVIGGFGLAGAVGGGVEHRKRPGVVQLGQGKWPDDFVDASKPRERSREANMIKPPTSHLTA